MSESTKRSKKKKSTSHKEAERREQQEGAAPAQGEKEAPEQSEEATQDGSARETSAEVDIVREKLADDEQAVAAFEELAGRAAKLDQVQAELAETKDQLVRQAASFQNFRRRTQQEKERNTRQAKGKVLQRMLDVLDDMDRSLEAVADVQDQDEPDYEAAYTSLREGVEMVHDKFAAELERLGVEPIEAVGKPFDENEHEAMMQQPAPNDVEEGTVLQEVQKGYRLEDRVLRHARVVVAGGS